jgi:hypothetical protein
MAARAALLGRILRDGRAKERGLLRMRSWRSTNQNHSAEVLSLQPGFAQPVEKT